MAVEAIECRKSGNDHGYGQCLQELEMCGFSVAAIRQLLEEAEADHLPSKPNTPHDFTANAETPRDPRMPIPQSEWPRPRYGFAS
ncbi:MAG TPA: hypothetical protein VFW52_03050 [Candidatus Saccharimonadales bacterium]|nr:hypothetical protein [Candidatus Saccharimonadales bacterium]